MRMAAGFFVVLCLGMASRGRATEPTPPASSPAAAPAAMASAGRQPASMSAGQQPVPAEQQGAPAPVTEPGAAIAAVQSNATATSAGSGSAQGGSSAVDPAALTPEDKNLLSRGYKLEMRHGEKYFCRREAQTGSRFAIKSCNTAEVLRAQRESAEEVLRRVQTNQPTTGN